MDTDSYFIVLLLVLIKQKYLYLRIKGNFLVTLKIRNFKENVMKKNIIILILFIIFILLLIGSIIVYAENEKDKPTLQEKATQEIQYVNQSLISILESFNDNSILGGSGKYEPDWDKIQSQIEQLYQTWNTVTIDLHALNIEGSSILAFSDSLNDATQNIKKKEKAKAMEQIATMHQLLTQYKKQYDGQSYTTLMLGIQNQIITAYVNVTNDKWNEANESLAQAENDFSTMLNTVSNQNQGKNQTVVNQCYILVNELKKASELKDKEIFFIQYQNLMTKMDLLV